MINSSGGSSSSKDQHASPKEKQRSTFNFFSRTRTLSNSSDGSPNGIASPHQQQQHQTDSISPRSLFDKVVRKRSQSDAKSPPSLDAVSASSSGGSSSNANRYQGSNGVVKQLSPVSSHSSSLQQQQQQELYMKKLNTGGGGGSGSGPDMLSKSRASSLRKHLNHSISEENDEIIFTEMNADGQGVRRMSRLLSESSGKVKSI